MRAVSTLWMSIPGLREAKRTSVRPRTPAALSNTRASAIWHTRNALRGVRVFPAMVRERERRVSSIALLFARNAGINPKMRAV